MKTEMELWTECRMCAGWGHVDNEGEPARVDCKICKGKGRVPSVEGASILELVKWHLQ